jgi:glutathione S-transferase
VYRLYGFSQSGNTFKVAFMLRALQQPWEPVFVDFMNGVTRTDARRAEHNVLGEVPVLEAGGRRMTQSAVILTHLAVATARPGPAWATTSRRRCSAGCSSATTSSPRPSPRTDS